MGGDEFVILLHDVANIQEAFKKIQGIMEIFRLPFACEGHELHVNASMGVSLYPEDGETPLALLRNADTALYEAKDSGRNHYKFYTAKLNASAFERLALETALRHALEKEQFCVYYQPKINIANQAIMGMEALVRWNHPELGLIPPDQFIPLAEETGLIVPLGKWVLKTACYQTQAWHQVGYNHLQIAVNLSARQFQESELVEMVLGVCQEVGFDPSFLELEITESILMKDLAVTTMILRWFNKKGITIAIDDFGIGYSSLAYLKRFPISNLKIDRSFIRDCLATPDDSSLVNTMVTIAHNLSMQVTAEGVETREQLEFLRQLGCETAQGYYFSPPVSAANFMRLLQEWKRPSEVAPRPIAEP
jgi:EAL domain-containing protein (putative c-di-GMP-specific phosphodiesterase class I)